MDPGLQDPCVVAAIYKYARTTEILWRKRDSMATLSEREGERARESPTEPTPHLDRLSLFFWAHYIEDGPHLLCTGSPQVITF